MNCIWIHRRQRGWWKTYIWHVFSFASSCAPWWRKHGDPFWALRNQAYHFRRLRLFLLDGTGMVGNADCSASVLTCIFSHFGLSVGLGLLWRTSTQPRMWHLSLLSFQGWKRCLGSTYMVSDSRNVLLFYWKFSSFAEIFCLKVGLSFLTDHSGRVLKRKGAQKVSLQDCVANKEVPGLPPVYFSIFP